MENRLYRKLLVILVILLFTSLYMTAYTYFTRGSYAAEEKNSFTASKPATLRRVISFENKTLQPLFTYAFPQDPSNVRRIAEQVIPLITNDTVQEEVFINSIRCPRYYFKTSGGNLLQVIYCMEGQLYQIIYTMFNPPKLGSVEYTEAARHLFRKLINTSETTLNTEIITTTYAIEDNTVVVSIHQAAYGIPIEKTGIRMTIDKAAGTVKRLIIYPIYRLNNNLPPVALNLKIEKIIICRDTPLYLAKVNNQSKAWINILNMNITSTKPLC